MNPALTILLSLTLLGPAPEPVTPAPTPRVLRLELDPPAPELADVEYFWRPEDHWLDLVTPTVLPPGSLRVQYEGLQAFAMKHASRRYRREWSSAIDERYDSGALNAHEADRARELQAQLLADQDAGGRWWERAWLYSLPGGAPNRPHVYTYGREAEILRLGPLRLNNELKGRLDMNWFDPVRAVAREIVPWCVEEGEDEPWPFEVKVKPRAKAKLSGSSGRIKAEASVRAVVTFDAGVELETEVSWKLSEQEWSAAASLALTRW